jgi:predicted DNA-binding transcriptional regulator AlpA
MNYLSALELGIMFDVSPETIFRWSKSGGFPKPIQLSKNVVRWRRETIEAYVTRLEALAEKESLI